MTTILSVIFLASLGFIFAIKVSLETRFDEAKPLNPTLLSRKDSHVESSNGR